MSQKESAALREEEHMKSTNLFIKKEFESAREVLINANESYGPHVGLLTDLVTCDLILEDFSSWRSHLKVLTEEYEKAKPLLSDKSHYNTLVLLAQHYVELCEPSVARKYYQQAEKVGPFLRVKSHLLRFRAFFGIKTGLSELYWEILQNQKESSQVDDVDVTVSLFTAELELFGFDHALEHYKKLLEKARHREYPHVVSFEFLEWCLLNGADSKKLEQFKECRLKPTRTFEKILSEMVDGVTISLESLNNIAAKVSPMEFLRILAILINQTNEVESKVLRQKFLFLTDALSAESRKLILKKYSNIFQIQKTEAKLHLKTYEVVFGDKSIKLKKNSIGVKVLSAFAGKKAIPLKEAIESIWSSTFDENSYDRTRMALARLNKTLAPVNGVPKMFAVTQNQIEIVNEFEIILVE